MANLYGDGNNNVLTGTGQADTLNGRGGHDIVSGGRGDDVLWGESGTDFLIGNQGNDTLHGGNDADILWGGNGNDRIMGGPGDDVIYAGAGSDRLTGGPGGDTFVFDYRQPGANVITDYNYADGDRLDFRNTRIESTDLSPFGWSFNAADSQTASRLDIAEGSAEFVEQLVPGRIVSVYLDGIVVGDYDNYVFFFGGTGSDDGTLYVDFIF